MNKFIKEFIPYIIIIILVVLIRSYIITPIIVRGDSMYDTLKDGEILFLSKISYHIKDIKRYDIIVIKDKDDDFIIKRVIGLPGDKIEYKDDILYINDKPQTKRFTDDETEDFTLDEICKITETKCNGKIPKNMYLALGDNRDVSADSRIKGLFTKKQILGKAIFRIWPLTKIGNINIK